METRYLFLDKSCSGVQCPLGPGCHVEATRHKTPHGPVWEINDGQFRWYCGTTAAVDAADQRKYAESGINDPYSAWCSDFDKRGWSYFVPEGCGGCPDTRANRRVRKAAEWVETEAGRA